MEKPPVDKQYEYFVTHLEYLNEKIIQSFRLFITLATSIVGGTFFLLRWENVLDNNIADNIKMPWNESTNWLFSVVSIGAVLLIFGNLYSWKKYRITLQEEYGIEIEKGWYINEFFMVLLIIITSFGFCFWNPLGRSENWWWPAAIVSVVTFLYVIVKNISNSVPRFQGISTWITAISTLLLALITVKYVHLTQDMLDNNQKQFEMLNRANVECDLPQGSRVDGGRLQFINKGNLPAEDMIIAYKIVQIQDGQEIKVEGKYFTDDLHEQKLVPDETCTKAYKSGYANNDEDIFLIVAWKYKGKGITGYSVKNTDFYWNVKTQPPYWAHTNYIDYKGQLGVVDNKIVLELKKKIELSVKD